MVITSVGSIAMKIISVEDGGGGCSPFYLAETCYILVIFLKE